MPDRIGEWIELITNDRNSNQHTNKRHIFLDACDQPKTEGPCKGNYTRHFFDKEGESCVEFQYGGCKGNNNNFLTGRECEQRCSQEGRIRGKLISVIN